MRTLINPILRVLFVVAWVILYSISPVQAQSKKRKVRKHGIDSSAVVVHLDFTCSVDKTGKVLDEKGNVIGTMQKDGIVLDSLGNIIGRRDKTTAEIITEAQQ